jgi:hypothetical protein
LRNSPSTMAPMARTVPDPASTRSWSLFHSVAPLEENVPSAGVLWVIPTVRCPNFRSRQASS